MNARLAFLDYLFYAWVQLSLLFKYSDYYCVLMSIKTAVSMYFTGAEIMDDREELANITKNQEGRRIWTGAGKKQGQQHNNSHVMVSILSRGKV